MAVKRKYSAQNTVANYKKFKSGTGGFKRTVPLKYRTGGFYSGMGRQGELKTTDIASATYACTTTGSVTLINGVATGTDFTDRIGRKTQMKSVNLIGVVQPEDGDVANNLARVMLVYDCQSNGAAPVITDILVTASGVSQLNLNNRDRFQVLFDSHNAMAGQNSGTATLTYSGAPSIALVKKYVKLNHEVLFAGTTNGIASIQTGGLFLVTCGSQATGSGSNFICTIRTRFVDA